MACAQGGAGGAQDNWKYSSMVLGDEKRPGVERPWASEYRGEFSPKAQDQWRPPVLTRTPRGVKSGLTYSDQAREYTVEQLLAQKIDAQSSKGPFQLLKVFKQIDVDGDGSIDEKELWTFLMRWNIVLEPEELAECMKRYDADGDGRVSYMEFLKAIFPEIYHEEFEHKRKPEPMQRKMDWIKWNDYRVMERGTRF